MAFTFFFRDQQVLERVADVLLPVLSGRSRPRIWDAGAAMGQEPYTLAIVLAGRMGHFGFNNLRIDATDVESTGQFARIAQAGVYAHEELCRLPAGVLEKYFEPATAGGFRVVDRIRQRVAYRCHDLLSFREPAQGYSLVLCKNVLLHFQPAERVAVLRMFHRALVPGGLFASELTQEMPPELSAFFTRAIPDAQVYRKLEADPCAS